MYYVLMRVNLLNKVGRYDVLVFDLWNEYHGVGYDVHLTISAKKKQRAFELAKKFIGDVNDISEWDKVFRIIKENLR